MQRLFGLRYELIRESGVPTHGLRKSTRFCRWCSKLIKHSRNTHCSQECSDARRIAKHRYKCFVCGKWHYRSKRRDIERMCCSNDCAAKSRVREVNWIVRSQRAKEKYQVAYRSHRLARWGIPGKLQLLKRRRISHENTLNPSWDYRIETRISANRPDPIRMETKDPSGGVTGALDRLRSRRKWFSSCPWDKKIANKMSNMRKRRRVKDEKERCKEDQGKITPAKLQMCFKWRSVDA